MNDPQAHRSATRFGETPRTDEIYSRLTGRDEVDWDGHDILMLVDHAKQLELELNAARAGAELESALSQSERIQCSCGFPAQGGCLYGNAAECKRRKSQQATLSSTRANLPTAMSLAAEFHRVYEMLAPQYGYETRPETREFDPTSANGRLMTRVCEYILQEITPSAIGEKKP